MASKLGLNAQMAWLVIGGMSQNAPEAGCTLERVIRNAIVHYDVVLVRILRQRA